MGTLVKSVLVHSCALMPVVQPEASLKIDAKYVRLDEDPDEITTIPLEGKGQYFELNESKCNCRQLATFKEMEHLLKVGGAKALWLLNLKKKRMELCQLRKPIYTVNEKGKKVPTGVTMIETHIWKRQQVKVPRVDVVSFQDVERAYLDGHHFYIDYIEDVHDMYMQNRLELFDPKVAEELKRLYNADQKKTRILSGKVRKQLENKANEIKNKGFKDDPTEGRLIFPFPPDERTPGGH